MRHYVRGGVSGLGFAAAQPTGAGWGTLIGDLSRQWTNIAGTILAPPAVRTVNPGGSTTEIRNIGLPSLVTSGQQVGVPLDSLPMGGAGAVVGTAQQVTGISTQTMFGIAAALVLVMVMSGRR